MLSFCKLPDMWKMRLKVTLEAGIHMGKDLIGTGLKLEVMGQVVMGRGEPKTHIGYG